MYCMNCGKEIDDNAFICIYCGAKVKDDDTVKINTNGIAVAGLIFSFFIPLLGWIFGGIGLSRSNQRNGVGRGMSLAAIIISTITVILNIIYIFSNR